MTQSRCVTLPRPNYSSHIGPQEQSLVLFVRKRDPRYKAHLLRQSQLNQQVSSSHAHASNSDRSTPKRTQPPPSSTYVEQDWQKIQPRPVDDDLEWAAAEGGEDPEEWECVACGKTFRSEAAWDSHERSKRHMKEVEMLRREMEDEEEFGLVGDVVEEDPPRSASPLDTEPPSAPVIIQDPPKSVESEVAENGPVPKVDAAAETDRVHLSYQPRPRKNRNLSLSPILHHPHKKAPLASMWVFRRMPHRIPQQSFQNEKKGGYEKRRKPAKVTPTAARYATCAKSNSRARRSCLRISITQDMRLPLRRLKTASLVAQRRGGKGGDSIRIRTLVLFLV